MKIVAGQQVERVLEARDLIGVPYEGFAEMCRKVAAQGAVLIKNEAQVLPIGKEEKISLFGRIQKDYYVCGTGSGGSVNNPYSTNLLDSLRAEGAQVNEELAAIYEAWIKENPFDDGGGVWAGEPWSQEEMPLTEEIVKAAATVSDKALIVIGRTAGEAKDYEDVPGGLRLSQGEREMMALVTKHFAKTALILNVTSVIDMGFLDEYPIDAVLYVWHGGQEGGNGAADVILGQESPSGRLADTVPLDIKDLASDKNFGDKVKNIYQEDIYVGYRYFSTFAPNRVRYPFGYGLSYTSFAKKACAEINGRKAKITVSVTNTGNCAGREVAQIYVTGPQGTLGRPAVELSAFGKTGLLAPGQTEELTFEVSVDAHAQYDDTGISGYPYAYIAEAGEYRFWLGENCADLTVIPTADAAEICIVVPETIVVQQLEQAGAPRESFLRLKPGAQKSDGSYEETWEEVPANQTDLEKRIQDRLPVALPITGDKGIKLMDVKNGTASLEDFIAQLSEEDLATIVRGEGMCCSRVTPGVASCFGGVSDSLAGFGIPVAACSDGPSGIRMDVGAEATLVPIGALLACTFDTKLVEELYRFEGKELLRNRIDTLLGPGANLHRHPLNGRNFEYFSEDPLLSGSIACANIRGIRLSGSSATIKHMCCNSQETERNRENSVLSERALRQIYLKTFEMAVKEGECDSIMTSYNITNGSHNASFYDVNTTIVRGEWGYKGIIMTDWWAFMNDCVEGGWGEINNTAAMVRSGNDLYMVVKNLCAAENPMNDNTLEALKTGKLTVGELQRSAMHICSFLLESTAMDLMELEQKEGPEQFEPKEASAEELAAAAVLQPEWIDMNGKSETTFAVEQEGNYTVRIRFSFASPDLFAQSNCVLKLNGKNLIMATCTGTNGRQMEQDIYRVKLKKGLYEFSVHQTRMAGIEIHDVKFF